MRGRTASRAAATSDVTQTGRPAMTRGELRCARAAESEMAGITCDRRVFGPVIQVTVPSDSRPASSSIFGPSAATTRLGGGVCMEMPT